MKRLIPVVLVMVILCALSVGIFAADTPIITVEGLNRVPECDSTTKYLEGYNLAVFKKGSDFVVWTEIELSAEKQAALVEAIEAADMPGLGDLGNPVFANGFSSFDLIGQEVAISPEGIIQFEGKSTWSWFYRGIYIIPDPVEYVWIQVGEDSATGYDSDGRITPKGNWFMYNTVDAADMDIYDSVTFNIQAGQYKNGTNFVGTYTVVKVGSDKYVITYNIKELDATHKIQFDDAKLWINGTGKFTTSPGNQKGLAVGVSAGVPFTFAGDTLYVFAHFDVSYWELVEVTNP